MGFFALPRKPCTCDCGYDPERGLASMRTVRVAADHTDELPCVCIALTGRSCPRPEVASLLQRLQARNRFRADAPQLKPEIEVLRARLGLLLEQLSRPIWLP